MDAWEAYAVDAAEEQGDQPAEATRFFRACLLLNASDIADWLAFERCLSLTYNNKGEGG